MIKRIELFAILSFAIPLSIYLATLAPSVTFFDSGEFITATACLGSPHSPGYPFFINYAKPFTYLPFGNVAFKVNIATAISGALASFGVYMLTRYLLGVDSGVDRVRLPVFYENWRRWLQPSRFPSLRDSGCSQITISRTR